MAEGARIDAANAEDVVIDFSWLRSLEEKLDSTCGPNSSPFFTICRVPENIRKCDPAAYSPRIVSIGPFHRGRENLQAMEKHKWRCLHEVRAFGEGRNNLEEFLRKMKAIETKARNCYSENIQMSREEFVEMMLLDACFIIFLILRRINLVETDVLIRGNHWMLRLILLDMLLLENQLPFLVLECLWELIGQPRDTLRNGALNSFEHFFTYKLELNRTEHVIHHLLHLLDLSLKPYFPRVSSTHGDRAPSQQSLPESEQNTPQPWNMIPSATELHEAGVRFRLKKARSFFQVGFEPGLMKMSRLWIFDGTNILFRNYIAFEQCFPDFGHHFTSYCSFIGFLVNTPRDVSILREADIIRNGLGSNEEVALLINKLCKEISWDDKNNNLTELFDAVNEHTQRRWPKWRAKLARDYFSNPWAIINFVAGVVLILILTFIQTYFSVFAYFNPPKP